MDFFRVLDHLWYVNDFFFALINNPFSFVCGQSAEIAVSEQFQILWVYSWICTVMEAQPSVKNEANSEKKGISLEGGFPL